MYQTYETVSGKRRYVGCSKKMAYEWKKALKKVGIKAFVVKL